MRNSEFLPNSEIHRFSYFVKLTAYTVPILMIVASIFAFEKTSDPRVIHGFILKEKQNFPSLNIVAYLYEHTRFHFPFLYLSTKDTHNFFVTTFRTASSDDSGALHILEHLIKHSSVNYPVRNLFQELKKRSFATLLTSYSSNEWTAFPFSTTNENDFNNILKVYFDAIFNPLINNETFYSECHRLEFEDPFDHKTPLHHDGTVYNEVHDESLKSNSRYTDLLQENLYPDSILRYRYLGTPSEISKLTISSLKQHHIRYYHPSNALFFHYGSFPVKKMLSYISDAVDSFSPSSAPSDDLLYNQPKWTKPQCADFEGQLDENTQPEKIRASVSWMCGDLRNISDVVDLEFLSILLTQSTVSPLFRGLIKTEFGSRFLATGYFPKVRSPYFSIGLEGFNPTFTLFNQTVLALLKQLYKHGFDANRVKSLLNRYEIRQKTISASQGLKIWKNIIGSWIHDVSPFEIIDPSWEIERLKKLLSVQPHYFEMIMKQKLIDNKHRLDLTMKGNPDFNEELIREEKVELRYYKKNMTIDEKQKIVDIAKLLKKYKYAQKPLNLLPSIKVSDLKPAKPSNDPVIDNNIVFYNSNVNGIVYVEIRGQVPLDSDYIEDIPLLQAVLTAVGADDLDEDSFSTKGQLYTGGIKCEFYIKPSETIKKPSKNDENTFQETIESEKDIDSDDDLDNENVEASFVIKASALSRNIDHLFTLLEKMLLAPALNNTEQIAVLISMLAANSEKKLLSNDGKYTSRYASAGLSKAAALEELLTGFTAIRRIDSLVQSNDWPSVSVRIQKVYRHVFRMANFSALIHASDEDKSDLLFLTEDILAKLNDHPFKPRSEDQIQIFFEEIQQKPKILVPSESNSYQTSVSIKGPLFKENPSLFASFYVLTSIIQNEFLYPLITEKLSLGVTKSYFDPIYGIATFSTLKDKNPPSVINTIEESITSLCKEEFNDDIIENAIINIVADLDAPIPPSEEGVDNFIYNLPSKQKLEQRRAILNVTAKDVKNAALVMSTNQKRYVIHGPNQEAMIPQGFELFDINVNINEN